MGSPSPRSQRSKQPQSNKNALTSEQKKALLTALEQFDVMIASGKFDKNAVSKLQATINSIENGQPSPSPSVLNALQQAWHNINLLLQNSQNQARWESFATAADRLLRELI